MFQSKLDRILDQIGEGVVGIADDVIAYDETTREHDKALHRLMKVATENGLAFRLEKCDIRREFVTLFGLIWSKDGVRPDPEKDGLANKWAQISVKELQSCLGMIQNLGPFIPHLAKKSELFRQILKRDVPWEWTPEHAKDERNVLSIKT